MIIGSLINNTLLICDYDCLYDVLIMADDSIGEDAYLFYDKLLTVSF